MRVLVLNCGSSSLQFAVVEFATDGQARPPDQRAPRGRIERIGGDAVAIFHATPEHTEERTCTAPNHAVAVQHALRWLQAGGALARLDAVGHRVVHGGERFTRTTRIDADTIAGIADFNDFAPLHNPACISGIEVARAVCGDALPMAAVFDTAFHHTLPEAAARYALPAALAARHHIRRYGFHGIAHQYAAERYGEISGTPTQTADLIILHLGNGCSITAVHHGVSVDTSMGFSPLEGLVMGTRCGDIDASVVAYLAHREQVSADTVTAWLNHDSGLLGISERSGDMRDLTGAMDTDPRARLAVEMFCHRASKYVGAYLTVLGGATAIIFSGGIGEHSPTVRARIAARLRWCGLQLDAARNAAAIGEEGRISCGDGLQAYVIPADEELVIARETARCIGASR